MFVIIDMFQQTSVKFLVWTAGSWTIQDGQNVSSDDFFFPVVFIKIQTQKDSNKCLFILTRTHSMYIFREIPFIKPQNNPLTTDKWSKTMKNERRRLTLFWFSFYSLFSAWKIIGIFFVSVHLSLFVFGSCFRMLAVILFLIFVFLKIRQIWFLDVLGSSGVLYKWGKISPLQAIQLTMCACTHTCMHVCERVSLFQLIMFTSTNKLCLHFMLCFVMGYVLHSREIAHKNIKRIHSDYYTKL